MNYIIKGIPGYLHANIGKRSSKHLLSECSIIIQKGFDKNDKIND